MTDEPEAIRRLYSRHTFGVKLGLDRIRALLDRMGNPQRELAAVHVAGTNGKGSVCAMIDSILRGAGYRTGIYTSPHLVRLNERIRVDGKCIDDAEMLALVEDVEKHSRAIEPEHGETTFFEFTTAMAFEYFRRRDARLVVCEVGMGGRLDATNVVTPLLSVITGISVEHAMYLGPDVPSIAREKAGIIKPGRPVVCGDLEEDAMRVVAGIAAGQQARLIIAKETVDVRRVSQDAAGQKIRISGENTDYSTVVMPLLGRHQLENCAVAVAAVEEISASAGLAVGADAVRAGLRTVRWPGRCDVIAADPLTVLDGGHNPGAAERFSRTMKELAGKRPVGLVFGMCSDKDVAGFLGPFGKMVKAAWAVTLNTDRAIPGGQLVAAAARLGWRALEADLAGALAGAEKWAAENNGVVCITGSLYLAGEVMLMKGIVPFE